LLAENKERMSDFAAQVASRNIRQILFSIYQSNFDLASLTIANNFQAVVS
jgi:hypothetical protein